MNKLFMGIKALLIGHFTILKHMFKPQITKEYPEGKPILNNFFRGKHILNKCIGCGFCQTVCPSDAINLLKIENKLSKYIIDYGKCIFCGNCMFYCPIKSMQMGQEFELATTDKKDLMITLFENKEI